MTRFIVNEATSVTPLLSLSTETSESHYHSSDMSSAASVNLSEAITVQEGPIELGFENTFDIVELELDDDVEDFLFEEIRELHDAIEMEEM